MTRTKICGITRLTDALQASREGVDALGFNFCRKSPRAITPAAAKKIIDELPPLVSRVGIFVEQSPKEIADICSYSGIAIAQLHSERYTPADAGFLKDMVQVIKVFRPDGSFNPDILAPFVEEAGVKAFLFDAYREGMEGEREQRLRPQSQERYFPLKGALFRILAGGLNPGNVSEAIRQFHPYGVDTASGVETAPGIKDLEKISAFLKAVRLADQD